MRRVILGLAATAMIIGPALTGSGTAAYAQVGGTSLSSDQGDSRAVVYGKLLNTTLQTVDFDENPLKDVIDFLSQVGDVDILVKWAEDFSQDGLDPEASITLHLRNPTQLLTVIERVLDLAIEDETTWILGDGYVEVGTKDMLNKNKYVRIYPVRELLFDATGFDNAPQMDLSRSQGASGSGGSGGSSQSIFSNSGQGGSGSNNQVARTSETDKADELIDIITSIVDPFQWELNGGEGGSIRYFRGSLIINASDYLHRQVGGYPFTPSRVRSRTAAIGYVPRYVSLTGRFSTSRVIDIAQSQVPIIVAGKIKDSGDGG